MLKKQYLSSMRHRTMEKPKMSAVSETKKSKNLYQDNLKVLIQAFSYNIYTINDTTGIVDVKTGKFYYIENNKIRFFDFEEAKLTKKWSLLMSSYMESQKFYIKDYFNNIIKLFKQFKMTFTVKSIDNAVSLGYPLLKKSLFKDNLLAKLDFVGTKFYEKNLSSYYAIINPESVINLDLKESNIVKNLTTGVITIEKESLLNIEEIISSIIITTREASNRSRYFSFFLPDIIINFPNFKGYNAPKDRKLIMNDIARMIRTSRDYNNFNMDDILVIKKIFLNTKTPQRSNALCVLKSNPNKQGLVFLSNLKKL